MANVISINAHPRRFPRGGAAIHRIHGWCQIVGVRGEVRTVRWHEHVSTEISTHVDLTEVAMGVDSSQIVEEEVIVTREEDVHADDLRAL